MFARSAAAVAAAATAAARPSVGSTPRWAGPVAAAAAPGGRSLAAAAGKPVLMPPLTVAVTGAAGQIGYALLMRIARCVGGRPPVRGLPWAGEGKWTPWGPLLCGPCSCVNLSGRGGGRQRAVLVDVARSSDESLVVEGSRRSLARYLRRGRSFPDVLAFLRCCFFVSAIVPPVARCWGRTSPSACS